MQVCANNDCNKEFRIYPSRVRIGEGKFCTKKCAYDARNIQVVVACTTCGKSKKILNSIYEKSNSKKFYCSRTCYYQGNSKENNYNYKEWIKVYCAICRKEKYIRPGHAKRRKEHVCSHECYKLFMRKFTGINSFAWQGGKSFEVYPQGFKSYIREEIRKRDEYICQICGKSQEENYKQYKESLCVHHIDYNKLNVKDDNLIALCKICHCKTSHNHDYWKHYFEQRKANDA